MKKYTKPTVEVVELSVKESLSRVPANLTHTFKKTELIAATTYSLILSDLGKNA